MEASFGKLDEVGGKEVDASIRTAGSTAVVAVVGKEEVVVANCGDSSIGDYYLKQYVMAEPEVTVGKRTKLDDFLVIASNGLWDALSNEVACQVVRRCL
ncbi:hypothetical protein EUGRSUZ_D01901 [Eucalyptus grandis]|uniref:Uncharacterized protein n=2 Tax=Eucalyptus grandis TaxID=71139 RepID=A0ACC3L8J4_EUCGR|nr:hypothetical protein EUGRSUZ_D01901 [Eucalyptus grandis]